MGATGWTGLARMPGINEDHRYARQAGLIANQRLELPEAPVSEPCPLGASGRNPCAYPLEVFKGDSARGALRLLHDPFADLVVDLRLIATLLSLNPPKLPSCSMGALALQVATAMGIGPTLVLNGCTRVDRAIRIDGQVDDAAVNAEDARWFKLGRFGCLAHDVQKKGPGPSNVDEIDFPLSSAEQLPLLCPTSEGNRLPSIYGPEADRIIAAETQDTRVVSDGALRAKVPPCLAIQLVGVSDLSDAPDDHLRGQAKIGFDLVVAQLVQVILTEGLLLPGKLGERSAGGIGPYQGGQQARLLFRCRLQLDGNRQFHLNLLLALNVLLHDRQQRTTDRRHEIAIGPECRQPPAQRRELVTQQLGTVSLDLLHQTVNAELWVNLNQQLHLVRQHCHLQDCGRKRFSRRRDDLLQPLGDTNNQDRPPVLGVRRRGGTDRSKPRSWWSETTVFLS